MTNKQLREAAEAATQDGWLPINTFDQKTAPYGGLIKAPSLIDLDFNPKGISIGCRVHDATDAPIATVKWNGSHDFYGDREITDATHWKPFDFSISDPESLEVLDAMIADRDYFVDENDKLKEQIATLTAERDAMREDAEKWRTLMSCERIRIMGRTHDYNHMGVEFWTKHRAAHPCTEFPQDECRAHLEEFVRHAAEPKPDPLDDTPQTMEELEHLTGHFDDD